MEFLKFDDTKIRQTVKPAITIFCKSFIEFN